MGVGGIMGGASSEISDTTTEVLLEAAYFTPMAIARTSRRLGLRTEASARFERGLRPLGHRAVGAPLLPAAGARACRASAWPTGCSTCAGTVPEPFVVSVPMARVHRQIGVELSAEEIARADRAHRVHRDGGRRTRARRRPRQRASCRGADQPARRPPRALRRGRRHRGDRTDVRLLERAAPHPDLAAAGRAHRAAAVAAPGQGRAVRPRRLGGVDRQLRLGRRAQRRRADRARRCASPTRSMRRSRTCAAASCPGCSARCRTTPSRRQPDVRLFEVGVVFSHPDEGAPRVVERAGAGGRETAELPGERELLCRGLRPRGGRRPPGRRRVARAGRRLPPRPGSPGSSRRRAAAVAGPAPDPLGAPRGAVRRR